MTMDKTIITAPATTDKPKFVEARTTVNGTTGTSRARVTYQVMVDGATIGPVLGWDGGFREGESKGIHYLMAALYAFFMSEPKADSLKVSARIRAYSVTGGTANGVPFTPGTIWGFNRDTSPAVNTGIEAPDQTTFNASYNKLVKNQAASIPSQNLGQLAIAGKEFALACGLIQAEPPLPDLTVTEGTASDLKPAAPASKGTAPASKGTANKR